MISIFSGQMCCIWFKILEGLILVTITVSYNCLKYYEFDLVSLIHLGMYLSEVQLPAGFDPSVLFLLFVFLKLTA